MIWGCRVAESNLIVLKLAKVHDLGSPSRIQRLSKVACSASPQVARSPSQIFQYNVRLHINAKVA